MLALPAKFDQDPKPITLEDQLHQQSAKTAGATHPAIFSLLSIEKPVKSATLSHDEDHDFWILNATGNGKEKDKKVPVPLRLVVIGHSEE